MKNWFKVSVILILLTFLVLAVYTIGRRDALPQARPQPEPPAKKANPQPAQSNNEQEESFYGAAMDSATPEIAYHGGDPEATQLPTPAVFLPTPTQIKRDLIGWKVTGLIKDWVFNSVDEFTSCYIEGRQEQGQKQLWKARVNMDVQDLKSGQRFNLILLLTYSYVGEPKLQLISLEKIKFVAF